MKQLEQLRARLVDRDHDDFVVGHRSNNLDHVLGIFGGQTRRRLVEKINVRHPDHIEADVESLALATAQRLLDRSADDRIATFAQSKFDQFRFQSTHAIAPGKMRRTNRSRELEILTDRQMFIERVFLRNVADVFF